MTLGHMLILWNSTEATMRLLLFGIVDPVRPGFKTDVLIAHLQNVEIVESLTAMADAFDEPMKAHLKHCAKLFDANRVYRNDFAHDPLMIGWKEDGSAVAMTQTTTAKGGALRRAQGEISQSDLDQFLNQLDALKKYISDLVAAVWQIPDHLPLSSLEMPPLPDRLERRYLNLIELARQQQPSEG
ncbi:MULTISPECIES: hypothetical protein [unclassified Sphingobium]|uniref:hypothetical protein n=1 Tax=unclassified Sphingobium TaxID=2611147 RepID=UPI0022259457|nr:MULTISPECIES: hypothetical protein [unclassified Sphingobium]MCW2394591.1 hypothetical protein [Sphingobium sp. B8D3B]MCW2418105.1 hypothetical protein [Sphingobium sp. B8D3C]